MIRYTILEKLTFKIVFCSVLILLTTATSNAQTRLIFPISPSYTSANSLPVDINRGGIGSDVVQSFFTQGKSYECSVLAPSLAGGSRVHYFDTSVGAPNSGTITAFSTGMDYPAVTKPDGALALTDSQHDRMRLSIIPTTTGIHTISFAERTGANGTQIDDVSCRETTLYGSYNRFFAQAAIVEIQNASSEDISVSITIVDGGGTVIVNNQGAVAKASTRSDIIFTNLPASSYGQIVITHAAPFGALSGYVAEYDSGTDGSITLKRERPLSVTAKADSSSL